MTVQEMIDELQKVKDKTIPMAVAITTYAQGSEWTGMYESGSRPVEIVRVGIFEGDKLSGVNELDEVNHVEIVIDDTNF